MGPSSVVEPTLLAAVADTPDPAFTLTGHIRLDDVEITNLPIEARRVGILFQDELLFPHLSVGRNLAFGLTPNVKGRSMRRQAVVKREVRLGPKGCCRVFKTVVASWYSKGVTDPF